MDRVAICRRHVTYPQPRIALNLLNYFFPLLLALMVGPTIRGTAPSLLTCDRSLSASFPGVYIPTVLAVVLVPELFPDTRCCYRGV